MSTVDTWTIAMFRGTTRIVREFVNGIEVKRHLAENGTTHIIIAYMRSWLREDAELTPHLVCDEIGGHFWARKCPHENEIFSIANSIWALHRTQRARKSQIRRM
jgi:hypothetical protein